MYRISNYHIKQAKKLDVQIKPSTNKNKKIDVYKNGVKIASIGARGYNDFVSYKKKFGLPYAEKRRRAYYARHKQNIIRNTPGYYAARILW